MEKIKLFIIAGEPSGDVLGAKLIVEIRDQIREFNQTKNDVKAHKEVEFCGIGGTKMQEQGLISIFPITDLSLMGFAEIVPHIPKLLHRINQAVEAILNNKVDIVITIDAPDFCFRVMQKLQKNPLSNNIKKVHFIAPSVWAYRANRAKNISKLYDLLLAILPFEPPYFEKYGLETLFIGHPITENNHQFSTDSSINNENLHQQYQIKDDDLVICAMAGSRAGEVKRILPEIIEAVNILVKEYSNLVVLLPTISLTKQIIEEHLHLFKSRAIILNEDQKLQAFAASNLAIAKSGTNNLEIAIAKLAMITIYKINPFTHFLVKRMVKIKFANLINIISNQEIVPELLQGNCCSREIAFAARKLINNPQIRQNQIDESQNILRILGLGSNESPSKKAAKKILSYFYIN